MTIELFAAVFIVYEILKLVFMKKFINKVKQLEIAKETNNDFEIQKAVFAEPTLYTLAFELCYTAFVIYLCFTEYWFVGAILLALVLAFTLIKGIPTKFKMIFDGTISIVALSLIFFI